MASTTLNTSAPPEPGAKRTKPRSRARLFLFSCVAVSAGILAALILAEFAVRLFDPQTLTSDIVIGDADVDYRLLPNARGRMVSPEFAAEIRVNSLGFRGPEFTLEKKPGVRRVLFLGDSFVFGAGLREDQTLPHAVNLELERRQPGAFETINGGVYGYQTTNEVEFFSKYGLRLKPDMVVILVMTHDMVQNAELFELTPNGQLKRKPTQNQYTQSRRITRYLPGAAWLREHSHLFKFVGMRLLPTLSAGGPPPQPDGRKQAASQAAADAPPNAPIDELSMEFYREERGAFRLTTALLNRLLELSKQNNAKCILLTLGGGIHEILGGKVSAREMLPHDQLIAAALESGFAGALALPPVLAAYKGPEDLFFPKDGHWTGVATRVAAPAVADLILRASTDAP